MCEFYKTLWIEELSESDSIATWPKSQRKKWSRFIFTRDLIFRKEPPFCRYGYVCRGCYEINKCWYDLMKDDDYFAEYAFKFLENMRSFRPEQHSLQLTLF